MRAGDLMTRRVLTVAPDAPIEKAVRLMLQHCVSGLPVVDGSGKLVGIITEGDCSGAPRPAPSISVRAGSQSFSVGAALRATTSARTAAR
jgi:CBS domain-containing protein